MPLRGAMKDENISQTWSYVVIPAKAGIQAKKSL